MLGYAMQYYAIVHMACLSSSIQKYKADIHEYKAYTYIHLASCEAQEYDILGVDGWVAIEVARISIPCDGPNKIFASQGTHNQYTLAHLFPSPLGHLVS